MRLSMRWICVPPIIAAVILLGASIFVFKEQILLAVGDFLIIQDELHPADIIHVISGPDYRSEYAIALYQEGYADQIFFTGGWCTDHQLYHGRHGKELAQAQGVPSDAIAIDESTVTSTYAEAQLLKAYIDQSDRPIQSVIVVSDPFHMRRARWTYRRLLGKEIDVQMAPVPFELTDYQRHWMDDQVSKSFVRDEYLKILYYYARYKFSWGAAQEWLASFDRE
jgi:uncharacterized SAM-binding protein YcdF (DUF218 family)